jgi:hypothetical protein
MTSKEQMHAWKMLALEPLEHSAKSHHQKYEIGQSERYTGELRIALHDAIMAIEYQEHLLDLLDEVMSQSRDAHRPNPDVRH